MRTRVNPSDMKDGSGLVYYLPLQAVNVTLTVTKHEKLADERSISVTTSAVFADHTNRFVAQYRSNQLGINALKVGVTQDGLLDKDTTSTLTTKVSDVLSGFATSLAPTYASAGSPVSEPCSMAGSYTWTFVPTANPSKVPATSNARPGTIERVNHAMDVCMITVVATPLFVTDADPFATKIARFDASSGFFYRQSVPYILEVTDNSLHLTKAFFVSLPTYDSPVEFLPVHKSFFANNTVAITFDHGMPLSYSESVDSEWLGVVSIPANVIKAYMTAIADAFKSKQTVNANQASYLASVNDLLEQQQKTKLCMRAIAAKQSDDQIKAACE